MITNGTKLYGICVEPVVVFHVDRNKASSMLDVIEAKPEPRGPSVKFLRWELQVMLKTGIAKAVTPDATECMSCDGTGEDFPFECDECNGTGLS